MTVRHEVEITEEHLLVDLTVYKTWETGAHYGSVNSEESVILVWPGDQQGYQLQHCSVSDTHLMETLEAAVASVCDL